MEEKLRRIAELHSRWDTLTDEETLELIELKNSTMSLGKVGFDLFESTARFDNNINITENMIEE